MAAKRLAEYREIVSTSGSDKLCLYRRAFAYYTTDGLMVSCFLYGMLSAFFLAIFLIRYRLEYVVAFPFLAGLFSLYFWLALRPNTVVQRPERLFRSRRLVVAITAVVVVLILMTFIELPFLDDWTAPSFTPVNQG